MNNKLLIYQLNVRHLPNKIYDLHQLSRRLCFDIILIQEWDTTIHHCKLPSLPNYNAFSSNQKTVTFVHNSIPTIICNDISSNSSFLSTTVQLFYKNRRLLCFSLLLMNHPICAIRWRVKICWHRFRNCSSSHLIDSRKRCNVRGAVLNQGDRLGKFVAPRCDPPSHSTFIEWLGLGTGLIS